MSTSKGHASKGRALGRYVACVGVAVILAAGLWVYSSYTATYATLAIESGSELSSGEMLLIGSGRFIGTWYIAVMAVLLSAALVAALLLGRRAEREAPRPSAAPDAQMRR